MLFEIFDSSADDSDDFPLTRDEALLADEANWPEELSLLASQLSADAARLAAIYPVDRAYPADRMDLGRDTTELPIVAAAAPTPAIVGWISSIRGARWIAAAAVLALASLATFSAYPSLDPVAEPNAIPVVQVAVNGDGVNRDGVSRDGGASSLQDAAMLFEETGFENLSSPAQEALLDLFEDDQLAQSSLSI
jgi:hypothetical protein